MTIQVKTYSFLIVRIDEGVDATTDPLGRRMIFDSEYLSSSERDWFAGLQWLRDSITTLDAGKYICIATRDGAVGENAAIQGLWAFTVKSRPVIEAGV